MTTYTFSPAYPTTQHARAAEAVIDFFTKQQAVDSVLLMGSCARGKADPGSCLDILILCRPENLTTESRSALEVAWQQEYPKGKYYQNLLNLGPFTHVDLEIIDGVFDPGRHYHGWTSGADAFELEVGNTLAYTVSLWERGSYFRDLREKWLPYYDEDLRSERLAMVLKYCRNNLAHIPLYAPRGLYFQSFKRLYQAFEEFLQALFISRRTYPIAYDKWVKEGVVDVLGLPELYEQLPHLLEIGQFESQETVEKALAMERLIAEYIE